MMRDDTKWGYVNNPQKLLDNIWDWREYAECFPRNIYPTDIDGMVEINHHFLFIETKLPNNELPKGQWLGLKRLSRLPRVTVFVIWGKRNAPEVISTLQNGIESNRIHCTPQILKSWFKLWVYKAQNNTLKDS